MRQDLQKFGKEHPKYRGIGDMSGAIWYRIKYNAQKRGKEFAIRADEAYQIFLNQNRKCALSGIELKFDSTRKSFDGNASLDRIDNSKGYIAGNVQWVHKEINRMKSDFPQDQFIKFCKIVAQNN